MAIRAAFLLVSLALVCAASGEECVHCHAPGAAASARPPQWNRVTPPVAFTTAQSVSDNCLGCHDGTSARAMHADDNHPLGVDYERQQGQGRARLRPSASPSGLGGTIADDLLVNGRVECSSCHDPHAAHGSGTTRLRMSNEGSRLCLTCHDR